MDVFIDCSFIDSRKLDKLLRRRLELKTRLRKIARLLWYEPATDLLLVEPDESSVLLLVESDESSVALGLFEAKNAPFPTIFDRPLYWCAVDAVRVMRLQTEIAALRLELKLVNLAIKCILRTFALRRRFSFQVSLNEECWRLLHGSHPPRHGAQALSPALAALGRGPCIQVC
jgi:hypothetical protein